MERHRRGYQLALAAAALLVLAGIAALVRCGSHGEAANHDGAGSGRGRDAALVRTGTTELVPLPLQEEAKARIEMYRDAGSCSLECAGYLDLFGNTWGCIVQGDGWVEVLVIRNVAEGTCSVETTRLEVPRG